MDGFVNREKLAKSNGQVSIYLHTLLQAIGHKFTNATNKLLTGFRLYSLNFYFLEIFDDC